MRLCNETKTLTKKPANSRGLRLNFALAGKMKLLEHSRNLVRRFSQEVEFYKRVLNHPRTPRVSKVLLGVAIAYAISPVDLIPDFIPVIGHLDDLVILPLLIWIAVKLIPKSVIIECRQTKDEV